MSEQDVDLVRSLYPPADVDQVELYRDEGEWAARAEVLAPVLHPDFQCFHPGLPGEKTYTGLEGFRAFWLDWLAPWETYRVVNLELTDLAGRVLVPAHAFGCLQGSAEEINVTAALVWSLRDGMIARIDHYADREEALEALGLGW
jgi:ketosteroid isomerase-like protein